MTDLRMRTAGTFPKPVAYRRPGVINVVVGGLIAVAAVGLAVSIMVGTPNTETATTGDIHRAMRWTGLSQTIEAGRVSSADQALLNTAAVSGGAAVLDRGQQADADRWTGLAQSITGRYDVADRALLNSAQSVSAVAATPAVSDQVMIANAQRVTGVTLDRARTAEKLRLEGYAAFVGAGRSVADQVMIASAYRFTTPSLIEQFPVVLPGDLPAADKAMLEMAVRTGRIFAAEPVPAATRSLIEQYPVVLPGDLPAADSALIAKALRSGRITAGPDAALINSATAAAASTLNRGQTADADRWNGLADSIRNQTSSSDVVLLHNASRIGPGTVAGVEDPATKLVLCCEHA